MRNDYILWNTDHHDNAGSNCVIIFEESVRSRESCTDDKKCKSVYWWNVISIFRYFKYLDIEDTRLFGGIAAYIIYVYLDDGSVLLLFEGTYHEKENIWSNDDFGWSGFSIVR